MREVLGSILGRDFNLQLSFSMFDLARGTFIDENVSSALAIN